MISSGQQCRITPEYVHIYRHLPVFKFSQSTLPDFSAPVPLNGFQPVRFLFPGGFPKIGRMITAHSCGRTHGPAVWYLLLFMSVYACSSRSRSSPVFDAAFSLQAARIMRSQAGIHPGRLFSFQGVNTSVAWPFLLLTPMGLRRT